MFRKDMSEKQVGEKELFLQKVRAANWSGSEWDNLLEVGQIDLKPEGRADFENSSSEMVLEYHAADSYLALLIVNKSTREEMRYLFYFGEHFPEVMDEITARQSELSFENLAELVKAVVPLCEAVFYEYDENNLIKVSMPDEGAGGEESL